jgi:hypothetical protein
MNYTERFDPDAYRRLIGLQRRIEWRSWVRWITREAFQTLVFGILLCAVFFYILNRTDSTQAWIWSGAFAVLYGISAPCSAVARRIERSLDHSRNYAETCVIDDHAYSVVWEGGVMLTIPWDSIEVVCRDRAGWIIRYGPDQSTHYIFRKPLEEAQLVEEFERRIGKTPPEE